MLVQNLRAPPQNLWEPKAAGIADGILRSGPGVIKQRLPDTEKSE